LAKVGQIQVGTARAEERDVVKLRDYLRISEAAEYLGVSPNTLRNWENADKIVAVRHPVNGYRLFKREDLDALLKHVAQATGKPSRR
jgi:MerR family copper efflux transcriptional regulator